MMKKIDCRLTYIMMGMLIGIFITCGVYYIQYYSTVEDLIFQKTIFEVEKIRFQDRPEYRAIHKCESNTSVDFFSKCVAWELKKK